MANKNLHSEAFDETTITKLEIFEDYAEAWVPTFVMQLYVKEVHIFDFFAGPGYDCAGVAGSPIRLLKKIEAHLGNILKMKTKIFLHFNEFEPDRVKQEKFNLLKANCDAFIRSQEKFKYFLDVKYYNEDAGTLFFKLNQFMKKSPSLVFLDQNGVKFVSPKFLSELNSLNTTDFLFYVSSSYVWRFGDTEEFKSYLNFNMEELKKDKYFNIHRQVIAKVKENLPTGSQLKLFPFSLKKMSNVYGIIFGSKHYRAVDKFLDISWKRNATNGEADFDIDGDNHKQQLDFFSGKKQTKIERFQDDLTSLILGKVLKSNHDVLVHTFESGHIPTHAANIVRQLKKNGKIFYDAKSPLINYDNVFKKDKKLTFEVK